MSKLLSVVAIFLLSGLCVWPVSAVAEVETITVRGDAQYEPLGSRLWYRTDPDGELSVQQLGAPERRSAWRKSEAANPSFSYTDSAYWFAFNLENTDALLRTRLIELAYPILDYVDLYVLRDGLVINHAATGDFRLFAERPIRHRNFVFPLTVRPQERLTCYLRVRTSSAMQIPLALWSEREFWLNDQLSLLGQGLYFGIILVMLLYNLFIYSAVRDLSYLFYVGFVSLFLVVQLALHGFAYQYFWPALPWLANKALVTPVTAALAFGALFTNELLVLKTHRPRLHKLMMLIAVLCAVTACVSLIAPYQPSMVVSLVLTFCLCSCSLLAAITLWKSGYAPARYYSVAWAALLIGALLYVLNKGAVLPQNPVTENAMQVGSALEVVLLSFALASRINSIRHEKDTAQAHVMEVLGKYQALFENAVEGIFQMDLHQGIINANRAMALTLLGVPDAAGLFTPGPVCLEQFFVKASDLEAFAEKLLHGGSVTAFEAPARRSDGSEFWASWSVQTVYDERGQPLHYEGSLVDITERRRAEEQIRYLAYFDELTCLPNRVLLQEQLRQAVERAKRTGQIVAVLWFDLDRFKPVNDTYGHETGDKLLRKVAARLTEGLRGADAVARFDPQVQVQDGKQTVNETVARLGGDEFVMVLSDLRRPEDAALVAQRVHQALKRPFTVNNQVLHITASIGIASYPIDGQAAETLLRNADVAMYYAKQKGSVYQFHSVKINNQVASRLAMETELRTALELEQFCLYFQSRVDLANRSVTGYEALCRWQHPRRGQVAPGEFIPIAEESGIIKSLGAWVLQSACVQSQTWKAAGIAGGRISINLSPRQFRAEHFTAKLRDILLETKANPECLELELTESVLMDDIDATRRILAELKRLGVSVAVDDFGTGYSSLSYLKHFPVDVLKIDRAFVQDIVSDRDNQAITSAIISMAQRLKLKVTAEGIETIEQFEYLRRAGCDEGQGYYISMPQPPHEICAARDEVAFDIRIDPLQRPSLRRFPSSEPNT